MLLALGEKENWATAHCSTVQVVTPYDNITTIMHEGASGGGKSEMLEHIHREEDGRLILGENIISNENLLLALPRGCRLWPVTDDMALCHPDLQSDGPRGEKKLTVVDAETSWFLRVNHIDRYGIDPYLERLTMKPDKPLLFLNMDAVPGATALLWEHIEDAPGKPCPNPRVIINREQFPDIVRKPVRVDIRSFGVRCPPCTREKPNYGIFGLFHILNPAQAWLWRLVSPRGHGNPSIISEEGLQSEGVGSYWPFATGKKDIQANILFEQIQNTQDTLFVLIPNQHIGAWKVGFSPQWVTREYLARRGIAPFQPEALEAARCPLLGRVPKYVLVENQEIPPWMLKVHLQSEVGEEGYDAGAAELTAFFHKTLHEYLTPDINPQARRILEACLDGADADQLDGMM